MRAIWAAAVVAMASGCAWAAPAPYPVVVDSRNPGAPPIYAYQSNGRTFRVTFRDGTNASPTTGYTPYLVWATNATAAGVATASVSVVSAATGIVDFTLSPAQLNYAPGRYVYEVGVSTGGVATTYRTGTFVIYGAPGASTAMAAWTPSGETLQTVVNRGATATNLGMVTWTDGLRIQGDGTVEIAGDEERIHIADRELLGTWQVFGGINLGPEGAPWLTITNYAAFSNLVQAIINAQ